MNQADATVRRRNKRQSQAPVLGAELASDALKRATCCREEFIIRSLFVFQPFKDSSQLDNRASFGFSEELGNS